ncbi:FERM domain-containing protein 3-like [Diorhabda sublineata]|uniref:FERM domain-containing protein 3-like n=1 Tax=Diorhabda sublineata TaxID=1163346 RepID=UPI0024E12E06|nr:FERM domain-containing protein 3-like [Diorhabda sublineata]
MTTVVSKTGIEVLYPCTIHLLTNGAKVECEYRSEQIGKDLLDYICEYLNLEEKNFWGLRFVDVYEQRHWLEPNKLIRSQVKNSCPVHFHFRVKIYPPEPFKLFDEEAKYQIFMQLRFDLISGRLKCGSTDSAMLIGLILQYTYGDYDPTVHFGNYVQEKILLNQTFNIEMRAIAVHKSHLRGLSMDQTQDLFLRMASQLETYGIDPHQVEDSYGNKLTLWINHEGMKTYNKGEEVDKYEWMSISDIDQEDKKIELNLVSGDSVTLHCLTDSECLYIFQEIQSYFSYFTTFGAHSTLGQIDNEILKAK